MSLWILAAESAAAWALPLASLPLAGPAQAQNKSDNSNSRTKQQREDRGLQLQHQREYVLAFTTETALPLGSPMLSQY